MLVDIAQEGLRTGGGDLMPTAAWFERALIVVATLYLLLAVAIIVGRVRYDRRRRLFARVARSVDAAGLPPDDPEVQLRVTRILHGWTTRAIIRAIAEGHASGTVAQACSIWILKRVGEGRLLTRAAPGVPRWKRIAALRVLALARADCAWGALEGALVDDDREVVAGAVAILGLVHDRRSAELLVQALLDGRHPRSQTAVYLQADAGNIGALLAPLFDHPAAAVRYWAAVLAATHPTSDTEGRLVALTGDVDPLVRKAALDSLGAGGFIAALPLVLDRLDDAVPLVRAHAARALGLLGAVDAGAALARRLGDADWWVRDAAKQSLVTLGRPAESALLAHLSDDDVFARNSVAEVLQHLGTFARLLVDEAEGAPDPRREVALAKLADAGGLRVWEAVLGHLPEGARARLRATLDMLESRAAAAEARI